MTKKYKLYLANGKYKIIDVMAFIKIAHEKMLHNTILKKKFINKELTDNDAQTIFKFFNIKFELVDALSIDCKSFDEVTCKTIGMIENDIAQFLMEQENAYKERYNYLKGSKESMLKIIEEGLQYKIIEEENETFLNFIEKNVYSTYEVMYNGNKIIIELSNNIFLINSLTQKIYKYKATIIDESGYVFNFKKDEVFATVYDALKESKKLINEFYQLPIKNSKIEKIIVRRDSNNTIIVFWPDHKTDKGYIISNDIIGEHDLSGETKTSLEFFENCSAASQAEIELAKNIIFKCNNISTYHMKKLTIL